MKPTEIKNPSNQPTPSGLTQNEEKLKKEKADQVDPAWRLGWIPLP